MKNSIEPNPLMWVGLSMGNTYWRWGYFENTTLVHGWRARPSVSKLSSPPCNWQQCCTLSPAFAWHQQNNRPSFPPLYLATVVEAGYQFWSQYPVLQRLTLQDIPLGNLYSTLGIDRALALLGAGQQYGWPVLVVDAGTALTFSGADAGHFRGGAIAPGLGLQFKMLSEHTAALPNLSIPLELPLRWAHQTSEAILSGVIHSLLDSIIAFYRQWSHQFPHSTLVFTGGDGQVLFKLLQAKLQQEPLELSLDKIYYDEYLIFKGMSQNVAISQDVPWH